MIAFGTGNITMTFSKLWGGVTPNRYTKETFEKFQYKMGTPIYQLGARLKKGS